ncbi:MAG: hypothetical protein QM755_24350 [Luteolibacter sp.]
MKSFHKMARKGILDPKNPASVKERYDFGGEILVGTSATELPANSTKAPAIRTCAAAIGRPAP